MSNDDEAERRDDESERSDDTAPVMSSHAMLRGPGVFPSFGPFGGQAERRCSFCDRREGAVARLVRGRNAFICDRCARLAAEAVDDPAEPARVVRLRSPREFPVDREAAEYAIERAYETVLGSGITDKERCGAIESGANLMKTMHEVRKRFPQRDQIDVSIEYVRFIDAQEAEVGYTLMFPTPSAMPGMQMPSKGHAVEEDGTWKMARSTYAELVARLGITLPPQQDRS